MKVHGLQLLEDFKHAHADARGALAAWHAEVAASEWTDSHSIKHRYATASFLAGNRVVFNIKGNRYRLVIQVVYRKGVVLIEWIGTHAEYNKKNF